ncbi:MAG: RNA 3'-terminal phosphate cyclase [Verrucomicrobiales bacterium]|nr:RNA 3'-terminal phosphate cyclase [Verrucomicrobiales bacterium]
MITLDGSHGEGGGQILRSSLALSLATGTPVTLTHIRARRPRPGLQRQHLTAVRAAAQIGNAQIQGDHLGSTDLVFEPGVVRPGTYEIRIGSAGSTSLVLQTLLPVLLRADGPSDLILEGGTHNPGAPPFPFLEAAFLPALRLMGYRVTARLERPGFYPVGGGRIHVHVDPAGTMQPLDLGTRPSITGIHAQALYVGLPREIAERELAVLNQRLPLTEARSTEVRHAPGQGNVVVVEIRSDLGSQVFSGFGVRGITAEDVAEGVAQAALAYLATRASVEEHLADQLLLPMALGRGGRFHTTKPSTHTETQIETIERFLKVRPTVTPLGSGTWSLTL